MARQTFTVQHGTNLEDANLGFVAQTILIDNPTPAYWYLPDQQVTIAPFTSGTSVPALGVQRGRVLFQPPPDVDQSIAASVAYATFTFTDAVLHPATGMAFGGLVTPGNNYRSLQVADNGTTTVVLPTIANPLYARFTSILGRGRAIVRIARRELVGGFIAINLIDRREVSVYSTFDSPIVRLGSYGAGWDVSVSWEDYPGGNTLGVDLFF